MNKAYYVAEVTSIGNDISNDVENMLCDFKVGDRLPVVSVSFYSKHIAFTALCGDEQDQIYCLLAGCSHLNGGSWKLMPYEVERE